MALNLALDKDDAFGDLLVEVEKHRVHRRLLGERAQPFDRLAGTLGVTDDAFHRVADLADEAWRSGDRAVDLPLNHLSAWGPCVTANLPRGAIFNFTGPVHTGSIS
jgi:hypothetical protein